MVFTKELGARVRTGEITTSIRIWKVPHVKVGGRYAMEAGRIVTSSGSTMKTGRVTMSSKPSTAWQRWLQQPQRLWWRQALFQIHLWSGIGLGLYIFFISVTGSVLVYRNELYVAATPNTTLTTLVSKLIELHADLLGGNTGRALNGIGALAALLMTLTGLVLWWPGVARWRHSLILHRGAGWKRFMWDLHSMAGFWSFAFLMIFSLSGVYLCFPDAFSDLADLIEPSTPDNAGSRIVDSVLYWLAFLHFGRINGIGIPCSGPGLCDQSVKAVWALFGLAPALMFASGATMWWNRVLRRWVQASK